MLAVACATIPSVFWTGTTEVFALPKLALLWGTLAISLALIAASLLGRSVSVRINRPKVVDAAVAMFVLLNVLAWIFSTDREQSFYGERLQHQGLLTVLLYVGFYLIARIALDVERRLRLVAGAVSIGGAVVALYALAQKAGVDPIWSGYLPDGRVFSSIGQPNSLAAYLVLAIPLSVSLLVGNPLTRVAVGLATAAMLVALFLTFSRAGYLAMFAVSTVLAVGAGRQLGWSVRRWSRIGALAVLMVAAPLVAEAPRDAVRESWGRISSTADTEDVSVRFHRDAWTVAANIAADHPLLGTGQETFPDVFPGYSHAVLPADRATALDAYRVESPHNVYLAIAAGTGVPALVAYLVIIAACTVALVNAARATLDGSSKILLTGLLAAIAGHLVTDAFVTAEVTGTWLFWLLLGSSLAYSRTVVAEQASV